MQQFKMQEILPERLDGSCISVNTSSLKRRYVWSWQGAKEYGNHLLACQCNANFSTFKKGAEYLDVPHADLPRASRHVIINMCRLNIVIAHSESDFAIFCLQKAYRIRFAMFG
jgi:hypothetical protein